MALLRHKNLEILKLQHDTVILKDIEKNITVVFDPYQIEADSLIGIGDVAAIFISHDHFDHFSPKDVGFLSKKDTTYIFPASILDKSKTFLTSDESKLISVLPLEEYTESIKGESVRFMAVPAYNVNKVSPQGNPYHPKEKEYVGFLVEFAGQAIYFAGDTDVIPEMQALRGAVDIAFLPVSGTYVMDAEEAVEATKIIQPKIVIPMHYGVVVGDVDMAYSFKQKLQAELPSVQVEIL
jgi:L-ascorbate metabolism protein UlaG (beta-lactamase superfamily)